MIVMNSNFQMRYPSLSTYRPSFQRMIQASWASLCLLVLATMVSNLKAEVKTDISPLVAKSQVISPTNPAKSISITLVLPLSKPEAAVEYAQRVSTPKDTLYGKYLTPQEFAARFGGNAKDYESAKKWAKQNELTISLESISRTSLTVSGKVSQFEQLFNVQINDYRSPQGDEFSSVSSEPTIPKALSSILMSVVGLNGAPVHAPGPKVLKSLGENPFAAPDVVFNGGTGPGGGFAAADINAAYAIPAHLGGTTPQTVAVFEISACYPDEIDKFIKYNKLPNVNITPRPVTSYGGGIWYPYEQQTVVDVDMIIWTNPDLK
jgi:subtilase family serine protease